MSNEEKKDPAKEIKELFELKDLQLKNGASRLTNTMDQVIEAHQKVLEAYDKILGMLVSDVQSLAGELEKMTKICLDQSVALQVIAELLVNAKLLDPVALDTVYQNRMKEFLESHRKKSTQE